MTTADILALLDRAQCDADLFGFDVFIYSEGAGLVIDYTPRPGYLEIIRPTRKPGPAREGMMQ